ncbi:MAG: GAK system ATP-grasp enzyme [Candidatus Methylomirabilis sp.]|nr:GAK system ATP-grasp enzyme [Deltaproteobacteria bacterium]
MKRVGVIGIPGGWSSELLADTVAKKTGERWLIGMEEVCADLARGRVLYKGEDLTGFDALIVKKITPVYSPDALDRLELLRYVAERGAPVFSNPTSILRVLDRLACTVTLRLGDVPMPPTVVTEDVEQAEAAVDAFGAAVFKPLFSTKARGMRIIEAGRYAREEIEAFRAEGNPVMYIQRRIALPGQDLGIVFLGGEYLATYARVQKKGEWNTTTNSGGRYRSVEPRPELIELAHKAQSLFDLDFTCVDVVESDEGPIVFEVSAFGGFRGLVEATGVDPAERYADYVLTKIGARP